MYYKGVAANAGLLYVYNGIYQHRHTPLMKDRIYHCPKCGSQVTKSCRILHEQLVNEEPERGRQRTFAKRVEPPRLQSLPLPVGLCVVGTICLFGSFFYALLTLGAGGYLLYQRHKLKPAYDQAIKDYERLWICTDCGHLYQPL